jgi:hypothetical protein
MEMEMEFVDVRIGELDAQGIAVVGIEGAMDGVSCLTRFNMTERHRSMYMYM